MVGEERIHTDDYLISVAGTEIDHQASSSLVEKWMQKIRARISETCVLSATVRMKPESGYFASFRLLDEGEAISSEAKADNLDEAVEKAAHGLCQHLPIPDSRDPDIHLAS